MRFTILPSRRLSWRRRLIEYAIILPIIYAIYCAALFLKQDRIIFPRSLAGPGLPAGQTPRDVESFWIDAGSEAAPLRIEAWLLPPIPPPPAGERSPAVLFFHGNAELIDDNIESVRGWRGRGYAVLIPEYRGYGRSGGAPSQTALTADAVRFYDILAVRPEIDPGRILFHGRSVGGGVAAQLAAARPPVAMVLESTFTSIASRAWSMGAPPLLVRHPFRNDRVLPKLDRPVILFHGTNDKIIPVSHSRRLHAMTPGSALVELPGGHNDFPRDPGPYWAAIDVFLKSNNLPGAR